MTIGSVKPQGYLPRVVDAQIERYLNVFGAIEIAGTKWCGKTWAALEHAASVSYVDENLEAARADPHLMMLGDAPHAIDEWQLAPAIWDAVRHDVDKARGVRGKYILTGSSTPAINKEQATPIHSGAGRIGRIRMYPMSLWESGESTGSVSLSGLFDGEFEPCLAPEDSMELVELACRGGWPEAMELDVLDAQLLAREYLRNLFDVSFSNLGLDPDIARRVAMSLSRNLGQSTTYKTVIKDMFGDEEESAALINVDTARRYIDALRGMFVIEEVPGWVPPMRDRKRFASKAKRYFADPSLPVSLLGMGPRALIEDWQTFGLVFENLVMRDLCVYARSLELLDSSPVRYYRDDSGLECDAVIELADGRWAAVEIKTSDSKAADAIENLKRMRDKLCQNPRARTKEPTFMAVITGVGKYAYQPEPGIYVVPIRVLKP